MSRWSSVIPGRGRRSGSGRSRRGTASPAGVPRATGDRGTGGPPVEDIDGVLLVRSVEDDSFPLDAVAEVAAAVGGDVDVVTVIVGSGAGGGAPGADHWTRLGALLDSLRARGTDRLRLVMPGAGDDWPDRPCVARRIADAWDLEVTAPDGEVLIAPGGTLFVHGDSRPGWAWWRFAPGEEPRKLGRRAPAPAWEEALDGVPERTAGGCVVERVPAGVLIRPAEAPGPAPDDLCFSVPVDVEQLTVLVGTPQAEDVAPDEVADVLAALPAAQRARARLAPGGRRDLLRLGQSVADQVGGEVEVLTGLPLLDAHAPPGTAPRTTLVGRDGRPSWRPFVSSVVCGPTGPEGRTPPPRPVGSHPPDWLPGGTGPGTARLTDRWQATVTRAGLALRAPDGPIPGPDGPDVDPEVCAIELGTPGEPLDGTLPAALAPLLRGLAADVRARTTLLVRGRLLDGDGELRRLAAEYGIPGIRYVTAPRPAPPSTRPRPPDTTPASVPAVPPAPPVALPGMEPGRPDTAPAGPPAAEPGQPSLPVTGAGTPGTAAGPGTPVRAGSVPVGSPDRLEAGVPEEAGGDAAGRAAAGPGVPARGAAVAPPAGTRESGSAGAGGEPGGPAAAGAAGPRVPAPGGPVPAVAPDALRGGGRPAAGTGGPAREERGPAAPPELRSVASSGAAPGAASAAGAAVSARGASGSAALPDGGREGRTAERNAGPGGRPVAGSGAVPSAGEPEARRRSGSAEADRATEGGSGPEAEAAGSPAAPSAGPRAAAGHGDREHGNGTGDRTGGAVPSAGPRAAGRDGRPGERGPAGRAAGVVAGAVRTPASVRTPGEDADREPGAPEAGGREHASRTGDREHAGRTGDREHAGRTGDRTGDPSGGRAHDRTTGDRPGVRPGPERGSSGRAGTSARDSGRTETGTGTAAGGGPSARAGAAPRGRTGPPAVRQARAAAPPFVPGHVSGDAERAAFRHLAAGAWEGHAAAVSRLLTRMPALRGHELEAARTDLVAVHAYLSAGEGPLFHRELVRDLRTGAGRLLPYAGCLASALRRLPSYRGVAMRGGDPGSPEPAAGALLLDPAPVSALAGTSALPAGAAVRHAIWSVTGRKVRQLLDRPGGSPAEHEEIVFAPGTGFRVLGVMNPPAGPSVVLLRELHGNAIVHMDEPEELSGLDLKALSQLEAALTKGFRVGEPGEWPERCTGPVGP